MKKGVDSYSYKWYIVAITGGETVTEKSRAEYFRERRKTIVQFNVSIPKEKHDALVEKLNKENTTKTKWLLKKIDEELGK